MHPLHFFPPVAWIEAQDMIVMETVGRVNMDFMIRRGDRSVMTRAFAVTTQSTALEGKIIILRTHAGSGV